MTASNVRVCITRSSALDQNVLGGDGSLPSVTLTEGYVLRKRNAECSAIKEELAPE